MKKKIYVVIGVVFISVVLIRLLWLGPFGSVRGEGLASPFFSQVSPSGKYLLDVRPELNGSIFHWNTIFNNRFYVYELKAGGFEKELVYTCESSFRTWDGLRVLWDDEDRVWVDSTDMGVFFWERQDKEWEVALVTSVKISEIAKTTTHVNGNGETVRIPIYSENDIEVPDIIRAGRPYLFGD